MNNKLWEIFKKTGDIKYYLLAKKIEGDQYGIKKSRRLSSRRDTL